MRDESSKRARWDDGEGRELKRRRADDDDSKPPHVAGPTTSESNECTLFLRNLPFEADEGEVERLFSDVGGVQAVRLVRERSGRSKGFAYVDFETKVQSRSWLR